MIPLKENIFCLATKASSILFFFSLANDAHSIGAGSGLQGTGKFSTQNYKASAYAAGKGCAGGLEGPAMDAMNNKCGNPAEHFYKRGQKPKGGFITVAVPTNQAQYLGCEATWNGLKIKACDTCPHCAEAEDGPKLDFSVSSCDDMHLSEVNVPVQINWINCKGGSRGGRSEAIEHTEENEEDD